MREKKEYDIADETLLFLRKCVYCKEEEEEEESEEREKTDR